jgi:hypothetical protein
MAARSSQLQIRVTEREKEALRRLAKTAGVSVSRYVLARALPTQDRELARVVEGLTTPGAPARVALQDLATLIAGTDPAAFTEAFGAVPTEGLGPQLLNQVAAMVEHAAHTKGADPPAWVGAVAPLPRPHFGWPLTSLRPHQLRVTPVPYKRRGLFFDPASPRSLYRGRDEDHTPRGEPREPLNRLEILAGDLRIHELKVEFYFLGGAILFQAFHARPPTAHVSALLRPAGEVSEAVATVAQREGWPSTWLSDAIREVLGVGGQRHRYVDLANLSAFVPQLDYVLALKVAAIRLGEGPRALDDVRYVMRALNLTTATAALEITGRYFSPRQLAPDTHVLLEGLFVA